MRILSNRNAAFCTIVLISLLIIFSGCKKKKKPGFYFPPAAPAPDQAGNPNPADGATGVSITPVLSWSNAAGALNYEVYFGIGAPLALVATQDVTSFDPGQLEGNTTYFWRIDTIGTDNAATLGNTWSFATNEAVSVTVTTSAGALTEVLVDGAACSAPYSATWDSGSTHEIGVPSPQQFTTGTRYVFDNWSDGGNQSHEISPDADGTYTANLAEVKFLDLLLLPVDEPARGLVRIEYEFLNDLTEEVVVEFEVSCDNGGSWEKPSLMFSKGGALLGNFVHNLPSGPSIDMQYVVWDSVSDIGFNSRDNTMFRARVASRPEHEWSTGPVFTVDNSEPAGGPTAVINVNETRVLSGEEVYFSAANSAGAPVEYHWNFGDGTFSSEMEPAHTFNTLPGDYMVLLTVTNAGGASHTASKTIQVLEYIEDKYTELEPYRNYAETKLLLHRLAEQNSDIMTIRTIGYSIYNREIYTLKISDNPDVEEDEPAIHLDSSHHAREVMTPEVMIDMAEQFATAYGIDPEVTQWINDYEIFIVPHVNPDGSTIAFYYNINHRKNARSVDPNRNYPTAWGGPGSSYLVSSETYRGRFPASEPEVQTIMAHALRERPACGITFHSHANIVLYPYYSIDLIQTPQQSYLETYAAAIANSMTRDEGGPYDYSLNISWLQASGVTSDWMYHDVGTFCTIVEVGTSSLGQYASFYPDYATYHDPQVLGVREGVKEMFRHMQRGAICGHVRDADTGAPLEADITITFINQSTLTPNGEIRRSGPKFGSFYWLWGNGSYRLKFFVGGYEENTSVVTVAGLPVYLDVQLRKNVSGNHRPTADFTTNVEWIPYGGTVIFDGTLSHDEDGDELLYFWDFGDNTTSTEPVVTHTYNNFLGGVRGGTYRVVLRVEDTHDGGIHETWKLIHSLHSVSQYIPVAGVHDVSGSQSGNVSITYDLSTTDFDPCFISVEYSLDGIVWYPATIAESDVGAVNGNVITDIPRDPGPTEHSFIWDSAADTGSPWSGEVLIKITPEIPLESRGCPAVTNRFSLSN
ncbi:MAG: M14 family zinc carboxypeptidase [Planctomycetota bacterium]|jgi:PKD repeat protein